MIATAPTSTGTAPMAVATRQLDFIAAILEADISPYMLGVLDAEKGELCQPAAYYTKLGEMSEYVEGHNSVTGHQPVDMTDEEIVAQLTELTDDMFDRLCRDRGAW